MPDVFEAQAREHRQLFLDEALHAARALGLPPAPTDVSAPRLEILHAALALGGYPPAGPFPEPALPARLALAHALRRGGASHPPSRAYYDHLDACAEGIAHELARSLPAASRVLDAGCGTGAYGRAYTQAHPGALVEFLDTAEALAVALPAVAPPHLRHAADLLAPHALPGPFDLILLANVVHLLPRDALPRLAQKLRAALRPGGLLVVKDVDAGTEVGALFNLSLLAFTPGDGMPVEAELTRVLEAAGFEVSVQRGLSLSPSSLVWRAVALR